MNTSLIAAFLVLSTRVLAAQPEIVQQAYLKASNPFEEDRFGYAVAISGDTVAVGAWDNSAATGINGDQRDNSAEDSGAVYIFVRAGTNWTQQAYIKASNTEEGDHFGLALALSGDTLVVGADGEDSAAIGINGDQNSNDAWGSGAAYVFVRHGTNWTQQAYLKASNAEADDGFGYSVAISGDTIVVGAEGEDSTAAGVNGNETDNDAPSSGAAYVFVRNGTNWTQQAYLKASNSESDDDFGATVAISGDTIVVGADEEDSLSPGVNGDQSDNNGESPGAAYVFVRDGTNWAQQAYLKASNPGDEDDFAFSLAISGDTIVVGAHEENGYMDRTPDSGAVYIYARNGTNWVQQAFLQSSNSQVGDWFGWSVAIAGDTVVVGAWSEDSDSVGVNGNQTANSAIDSGGAYLFVRRGTNWIQHAYLKASNTAGDDAFGFAVGISRDTLIVSADGEDSGSPAVNGAQNDNSTEGAGAAYISTSFGVEPPSSNETIHLKWPRSEHFAIVESASVVEGPWSPQVGSVVELAEHNELTVPLADNAQCFRLQGGFGETTPVDISVSSPSQFERGPSISRDGLSLYYFSLETGQADLMMNTRPPFFLGWAAVLRLSNWVAQLR